MTRLEEPSGQFVAEVTRDQTRGFVKGIAADTQGVWAGISDRGLVVRIDPSTNEVVAEIEGDHVALRRDRPATGRGLGLEPATTITTPSTSTPVRMSSWPRSTSGASTAEPVLVDGYPWFPVGNRLVRIDPATDRIDQIVAFTPDEFTSFGATVGL